MEEQTSVVADIFTDRNWKALSQAQNEEKGFSPNRGYFNPRTRQAAVVIHPSKQGDYALSKTALDALIAAEEKGSITKAFVVLKDAKKRAVVASLGTREVKNNLKDTNEIEGDHGSYWWINTVFEPAGGTVTDDDIPF